MKRASSSAQVAAMRSNLKQQEENLAAQKKQLEALEAQLKQEEEEEDNDTLPQQYPSPKASGDRGMPTVGGFVMIRKTDKGEQIEKQKNDTRIRPALPNYK